jgi:hypothetical protein
MEQVNKEINQIKNIKKNLNISENITKSKSIDKHGYTYFKPNLENIKKNINYDINNEMVNLIREYKLHDNFNNLNYSNSNYINSELFNNENIDVNNNNRDESDDSTNICNDCINMFGKEIQASYNYKNFNSDKINIIKNIQEYYKLLQKSYFFDYMFDPTKETYNRIKKLNKCYEKLISEKCIVKSNLEEIVLNPFILYKNNLEIINSL